MIKSSLLFVFLIAASFGIVSGQAVIVVNDPTKAAESAQPTAKEKAIFEKDALPAAKKTVNSENCDEQGPEISGVARGAFSKVGAKQTVIFYQYCQTGNGLGWVGLVLIDGDKVVGNYVADSGWTSGIFKVADVNKNGLDEFTLAYGGGMHQGQGGVGVDLMEFVNGVPKGLGWYQAEAFDDTEATTVWKLTAKPGKVPVYYRQKYFSGENKPYKPTGANAVIKLKASDTKFESVK